MSADDPLIRKKLGDYTIVGLLGRGGMSRVYKGYDENLERFAAIKVISGDFATTTEEEYTRRFQSEARAIARLRHPNIVGIYQFGRTEGIYYMAQVFLEGKDLRSLLKEYAEQQRRMPPIEVIRIARDVASALDYAHEQGVIHRDIKPSNIMLEKKTNRAILMDFGLALSIHEGTMGDTFGSAHYIAPEQAISSAKAVPQSDLYSLGIVLYEMGTGRVPFDDPSVMSVALKHLNEIPPPPSMYNPDLPPAVERVIMRALEKDPTRRYATGADLAAALEHAFAVDKPLVPSGTPLVADLLESRPEPPDRLSTGESAPVSRPSMTPAAPAEPPPKAGLAGRFARRKAEKEVQQAMTEGLALDTDSISKLLEQMPDPSQIGLVGEGAKGITRSEPPGDQTINLAPKTRRRSRVGLLLALLLVVVVLAAGWWLGTRGGNDKEEPTGQAGNVPAVTQTASVQTATALAVLATTSAQTRTVESISAANETLNAAAVIPAETETPSPEPTETATAQPSRTPAPTLEATQAPTSEPTATPTEPPTAAPTETPAASPTQTLAAVVVETGAAATATPSPGVMAGTESAPLQPPDLRLLYDQGQFVMVNLSEGVLDVSGLVFEQDLPDGSRRTFLASDWTDRVVIPPNRMVSQGCYQLLTVEASRRPPRSDVCAQFLGYFQTGVTRYYFWVSDRPGASFTVRAEDSAEVLARCDIGAGMCEFALDGGPVVVPTATLTPTPKPPTPVPTLTLTRTGSAPQGNLRLLYNRDWFLLTNVSSRALDVSELVFEQVLPNGDVRQFEAVDWDRVDMMEPPTRMTAGGCYQLVTAEGEQTDPEDQGCFPSLGWFRTGVTQRYFWISDRPGATFSVWLESDAPPLGVCEIDAGECWITLPR